MDSLQESPSPTEDAQALSIPVTFRVARNSPSPAASIVQGRAEIAVLEALLAEARPLTLGQLRRVTGLPGPAVEAAVRGLHDARMIRALNTLIESYVSTRSGPDR